MFPFQSIAAKSKALLDTGGVSDTSDSGIGSEAGMELEKTKKMALVATDTFKVCTWVLVIRMGGGHGYGVTNPGGGRNF